MYKLILAAAVALTLSTPALAQPASHAPTSTDVMKVQTANGSYQNAKVYTETAWTFGTIPVVTGTGTPTIATGSTDQAGEVTGGTSATSIVITFAAAKTNAPFCVVSPQTHNSSFDYTISTTAITITQTAASGTLVDYHCLQH